MRKPVVLTIATALLLGLAGCAANVTQPEADACSTVAGWYDSGHAPAQFERVMSTVEQGLRNTGDRGLAAEAKSIADSAQRDWVSGAQKFLSVCTHLGWKPGLG